MVVSNDQNMLGKGDGTPPVGRIIFSCHLHCNHGVPPRGVSEDVLEHSNKEELDTSRPPGDDEGPIEYREVIVLVTQSSDDPDDL